MFTTVNPIKNSQRKTALDLYLQHAIAAGQGHRVFLLFLTTTSHSSPQKSVSSSGLSGEPEGDIDSLFATVAEANTLKEGYLMKKRNFGGWKPRYFKCKQYFLDYSDMPNQETVNTISLKHCHVTALLPMTSSPDQQKTPMHALVLIEFHRDEYPVPLDAALYDVYKISHRHVLVADNDRERDEWIAVIEQQIRDARAMERVAARAVHSLSSAPTNKHASKFQTFYAGVSAMGGAVGGAAVAAAVSMNAMTGKEPSSLFQTSGARSVNDINGRGSNSTNVPTVVYHVARRPSRPHTAGAIGSTTGFTLAADHFKSPNASEAVIKNSTDDNARAMQQVIMPLPLLTGMIHSTSTIFPVTGGGGGGGGGAGVGPTSSGGDKHVSIMGLMQMRHTFKKKTVDPMRAIDASRAIFGMSLEHGVKISRISDDLDLPAVVYRCIEFLDYHKATQEEGIYRLSGSTSAIQQLKALFNSEADVDLITHSADADQIDVHVVSGLLKLYLRELATPILTNSLQKMFAEIIDLDDRNDRVLELSRLISQLPKCNYILLKIMSSHLLGIVQASDVNKMNVRNMGIVFAPTLGVPAVVFILMLAEFEDVFCWDKDSRNNEWVKGVEGNQRQQQGRRQKVEEGIKELLARKERER
ncbi:hypothetical protein HDU84_005079 [Entophlyctis sp. JEL0112]|nr:hypothetical protein HDU84_005079 [Entophlyctis sp. JEL0112]